jgi:DNA-binding transcriptional regulator LsrR (DeoR family)
MSSESRTSPSSIRREAEKDDVAEAIRSSEFSDAGSREVARRLDLSHGRVRKLVQDLREEGRIRVTRTVGPAKLYRVAEEEV